MTGVSERRAQQSPMTLILPPNPGQAVRIVAPQARLRGQVVDREDVELTVALEQGLLRRAFRFPVGAEVDVEWTHDLGVMQLPARVEAAQEQPRPTLLLEVAGDVEPVERRSHERAHVELPASAWSLAQPTRRFEGNTIDLSTGGAQLWFPELPLFAATLELSIALPHAPVHASASIRWRRGDVVGVGFDRISGEAQARLLEHLRQ